MNSCARAHVCMCVIYVLYVHIYIHIRAIDRPTGNTAAVTLTRCRRRQKREERRLKKAWTSRWMVNR